MTATMTLEDAIANRDALIWCLEQGYCAEVIEALLTLIDDSSHLGAAANMWAAHMSDKGEFLTAVSEIGADAAAYCDDCSSVMWTNDANAVGRHGYRSICADCFDEYHVCASCEDCYSADDMIRVYDELVCDRCLENYYSWCGECQAWYFENDDEHDHELENQCDCDVPHPSFLFPANGHGTIASDEALDVALPAGTISQEGINAIANLIDRELGYAGYQAVHAMSPIWQTKQGNFTRRLSKALYQAGIKATDGVLSEVGNLARQHSTDESSYRVDFTRKLNEDASYFFHGDSCWWGGYGASRCCLKNFGGLGMRTIDADNDPTGRAWVQPLDVNMQPTHDTMGAHAYVVYNCYGLLSGYTAARIVAHLTDKTYRTVSFGQENTYVNGDMGYLVADEATCNAIETVHIEGDQHDRRDA